MISRYFMEVCYKGNAYAGFQVQENARTIQGEVERACRIVFRKEVRLTGSSRTDAGVHARQNYFHFDFDGELDERIVYNINSILPVDIAVKRIRRMHEEAHCRFDAVWRRYRYLVYGSKDPFSTGAAYYFPYKLDVESMCRAALLVKEHSTFEAFSKRNTQVKTFECRVDESRWTESGGYLVYEVRANRFLRGMVRGLVGTMLRIGRGSLDVGEFGEILSGSDIGRVDFAVPGHGLWLEEVAFPAGYFG